MLDFDASISTGPSKSSVFSKIRLSAMEIRRARRVLHMKALAITALGLASYMVLVLLPSPLWLQVLGFFGLVHAVLATATGIMHDAAHSAFSSKRWLNRLAAYSADLLGASSMLWRLQHNVLHHRHTNIEGLDGDIDQMPFARLSPSQPLRSMHRFQHLYMWFLYGFLTLRWFVVGDWVGLSSYRKNPETADGVTLGGTARMVLGKVAHALWALVLPLMFHPWWCVLLVYLAASYAVGFVLAVTFQVAHCVSEADFLVEDPGPIRGEAIISHQLATTLDVTPKTFFAKAWVSFVCGGLHYQVEHHVAPRLPHTAYPLLQKRLKAAAASINIAHRSFPSVSAAVRAHARHLRRMGSMTPA